MDHLFFIAVESKGENLFAMTSVIPEHYAGHTVEVQANFEDLKAKFESRAREFYPDEDTLQLYIDSEGYVRVHVTSAPTPWLDNHPFVIWLAEGIKEEAKKNGWKGFVETDTPLLLDEIFGDGEAENIAAMYYDEPAYWESKKGHK